MLFKFNLNVYKFIRFNNAYEINLHPSSFISFLIQNNIIFYYYKTFIKIMINKIFIIFYKFKFNIYKFIRFNNAYEIYLHPSCFILFPK